jgi:L-alanine-DL-glutamate epimerase-like enolase superfamily enzyme
LQAGDYAGLARVAAALDTKIILDESMLRAQQLEAVSDTPGRWIVNLRVSKMGGMLRSLQLVSELRERHIGLIVGAHVGETSLLTRGALTVANAARDILVAQEGAFGTHLLAHDVVDPPLMFGPGGLLDAAAMPRGAGWGLVVRANSADTTELPAKS